MIHLLMRAAIHHQVKEEKAIIPDNYLDILRKYERMKCSEKTKIKFSWLFDIADFFVSFSMHLGTVILSVPSLNSASTSS